jgi:hypothetical protein
MSLTRLFEVTNTNSVVMNPKLQLLDNFSLIQKILGCKHGKVNKNKMNVHSYIISCI